MTDPNPYQTPNSFDFDHEQEPKRYKSSYRGRDNNQKYIVWIMIALLAYAQLFRYLAGW